MGRASDTKLPAMIQAQQLRSRLVQDGLLAVCGCLVLLIVLEASQLATNADLWHHTGFDYKLYMDATHRWLAGGSFYPPQQLAGPYDLEAGAVLYPPQMLALFVPFSLLPAVAWYAIPIAITGWMLSSFRPAMWAVASILALVAFFPWSFMIYVYGTPTIWLVAVFAVALRYSWVSALILVKPTLLPFALVGVRDWRWWTVAISLLLVGVLMLPMTLDWVRSLTNGHGSNAGILYSLENVPVLLVPVAAWAGRTTARGVRRGGSPHMEGPLPEAGR